MNPVQRSYALLHISILLWGFTAILGALITLSAGVLVWWRVGLTSVLLFLWPGIRKAVIDLPRIVIFRYVWIGVLIALHWVSFFAAVKFANASIALITMSTTALFTAFIEPIVLKSKLNKLDVGLSIMVIPAMILTCYNFEDSMMTGFWLGLLAALLLAYFTVLNRQYIADTSSGTITFLEMSAAWIFLTICSPILFYLNSEIQLIPISTDIVYLLILSVGCTILPFILHLEALKHISAFTTNLVINLEPVYGLILAVVVLNEHKELGLNFYIGASILIIIISVYPLLRKRQVAKLY